MKVVLFDGMNLIHRARSGFSKGDYGLVYSFYRSFKPLFEKLEPDLAFFVLEGRPKHRSDIYKEYKSNRPRLPDDFWRQQQKILEIMEFLPVIQIRHADYECDDVIANLTQYYTEKGDDVTIVSGDSDFIQVFDTMNGSKISIYHPIKKLFVLQPDYCYLDFKSLVGDTSDNIPGIRGVGEKTALKILRNESLMLEVKSDPEKREILERNRSLVRFAWFDKSPKKWGVEINKPSVDFVKVKSIFNGMNFKTMTGEKYWLKFSQAFSSLSEECFDSLI